MAPLLDQFSFHQKTTGIDQAQQHAARPPSGLGPWAKATTVMLKGTARTNDSRPHPAFRCLVCDTQWYDQDMRGRAESTTDEGGRPPPGRADA